MRYAIEEKLTLGKFVTPKPLLNRPIHRWYLFPHSFTSELVHELIEKWALTTTDQILDPFVGAGTTLLAAKERGIPAVGYDLSPLAVLSTRAKITNYRMERLKAAWKILRRGLDLSRWDGASRLYPILVREALPGRLLGAYDAIVNNINSLPSSGAERDFFTLALLKTMPKYSRAKVSGGWLEWASRRTSVVSLPATLIDQVEMMLGDLETLRLKHRRGWRVEQADARALPDRDPAYSAIITSPPYPNRHDYTRVFGVELMFRFLSWSGARRLRYQCIHSHPEAKPRRPDSSGYAAPEKLTRAVRRITKLTSEPRIPRMLEGYFLDMYLCLREMKRVSRPNARIALVLGNAQYCGQTIRVDELTAEIGEQLGLRCEGIEVTRYRGNSAQQMGEYGRNPSRESIVVLRNGKGSKRAMP